MDDVFEELGSIVWVPYIYYGKDWDYPRMWTIYGGVIDLFTDEKAGFYRDHPRSRYQHGPEFVLCREANEWLRKKITSLARHKAVRCKLKRLAQRSNGL